MLSRVQSSLRSISCKQIWFHILIHTCPLIFDIWYMISYFDTYLPSFLKSVSCKIFSIASCQSATLETSAVFVQNNSCVAKIVPVTLLCKTYNYLCKKLQKFVHISYLSIFCWRVSCAASSTLALSSSTKYKDMKIKSNINIWTYKIY